MMMMDKSPNPVSLLVFGPQRPLPSPSTLLHVHHALTAYPSFHPFKLAISGLPALWRSLAHLYPSSSLARFPPAVDQLLSWVDGSDDGALASPLPNCILAPLSILVDLVHFHDVFLSPPSKLTPQGLSRRTPAFLGVCTGSLSAAVAARTFDYPESFPEIAAIAVRHAFLCGALVDARQQQNGSAGVVAVRYDPSHQETALTSLIAETPEAYIGVRRGPGDVTVTLPKKSLDSFGQSLRKSRFIFKVINLEGRYHCETNEDILQTVLAFCEHDRSLQWPELPNDVRIWADAEEELIAPEATHTSLLKSILVKRSDWVLALNRMKKDLSSTQLSSIDAVGGFKFLPREFASSSETPIHYHLPEDIQAIASVTSETSTTDSDHHNISAMSTDNSEMDIAIVGMACRVPGASSPEELWELLSRGTSHCKEIPPHRFSETPKPPNDRRPTEKLWANLCSDIDSFDHSFFNISPREAKFMDPQQRNILEVTYEALQSANYLSKPQREKSIGCYLGVGAVEYFQNVASHDPSAYSAPGTLRAFISGRISHHFGWTGPSICYDTACSSSLVAIHSAVQAIRNNECAMALAGGVSLITSPEPHKHLARADFLSPNGASRAFDADASGYCRGEGTGAVVLKKLSQAIEDGDNVLAVIAASAVNQGDNRTPITVPSPSAQQALYEHVCKSARIDPHEVAYVEAHGTGTPVGDPIEMASIQQVFGGESRPQPLLVGSLKSNIGHLEAASGVAALIKSVLVLQHQTVPTQANFKRLNPKIQNLARDRVEIPQTSEALQGSYICVNNYGAAGNNAALIVRQFQSQEQTYKRGLSASSLVKFPFVLSAHSAGGMTRAQNALLGWVQNHKSSFYNIANLSAHLMRRADASHRHVFATSASSLEELETSLISDDKSSSTQEIDTRRENVLCFGGQNRAFVGLDRALYESCPTLSHHLQAVDKVSQSLEGINIFPEIFSTDPVEDVVKLHTLLFAIQYACARSWIDCGLAVTALIGHSFGQLTASCVADALSLEDGLRLVQGRAKLIREFWGSDNGAMLSIDCRDKLEEPLSSMFQVEDGVEVACYNSPSTWVLAGPTESIQRMHQSLEKNPTNVESLRVTRLPVTHGFHSCLVDPILPSLTDLASKLKFKQPRIHLEVCNGEGDDDFLTPRGIAQHSRQPVRFSDAVERIVKRHGSCNWIEAGTSSGITSLVRRITQRTAVLHPMNISSSGACDTLVDATMNLWLSGAPVQFWPFHGFVPPTELSLPSYQFEKSRHWLELKPQSSKAIEPQPSHEVNVSPLTALVSFIRPQTFTESIAEFVISTKHPYFETCVNGHAVAGSGLCPASVFISIVAELAARTRSDYWRLHDDPIVEDVHIQAPLVLKPDQILVVSFVIKDSDTSIWSFKISSYLETSFSDRTVHTTGNVRLQSVKAIASALNEKASDGQKAQLSALLHEGIAENVMEGPMIYKMFSSAVKYNSLYRGVRKIASDGDCAAGRVSLAQSDSMKQALRWNPMMLDNFLQVSGLHANCLTDVEPDSVYVCVEIKQVDVHPAFASQRAEIWDVLAMRTFASEKEVSYNIYVFNASKGNPMVEIHGARFVRTSSTALSRNLGALKNTSKRTVNSDATSSPKKSPNPSQDVPNDQFASEGSNGSENGSLFPRVKALVCGLTDTPVNTIKSESKLMDIGVDSLMTIEILREVEDQLRVKITLTEFQDVSTFGQLCNIIRSKLGDDSEFADSSDSADSAAHDDTRVGEPDASRSDYSPPDNARVSETSEAGPTLLSENETRSFQQLDVDIESLLKDTSLHGFYELVFPLQMELVLGYITAAFRSLGCDLGQMEEGSIFSIPEHSSKWAKLMQQLGATLSEMGYIVALNGEEWQRTGKELSSIQQQDSLLEKLNSEFPQHRSEHDLLNAMASNLEACLIEKQEGVHLMFGDKTNKSLVESVYRNAPMFALGTKLLSYQLSKTLRAWASTAHKQPLRLIEIGAGTGATTREVLRLLEEYHIDYEYTFTDISSTLVSTARKTFAGNNHISMSVLNIESDPAPELQGQFDLAIATNVVHATRNLSESCTNIRKLLNETATLFLVELTRNLPWFDLVFGLLKGWWAFEDDRKHAIANEEYWRETLLQSGYDSVSWTDSSFAESQLIRVITATTSGSLTSSDVSQQFAQTSAPVSETSSHDSSHTPASSVTSFDDADAEIDESLVQSETLQFAQEGPIPLYADVYYPPYKISRGKTCPIAIFVHGGGHVMLSRKDIRPAQKDLLLAHGFVILSVDYRLCPEVNLLSGPMQDVGTSYRWARTQFPNTKLARPDVIPDGERIMVVGWSTGGHLALSTAFTSQSSGIRAPDAILSFYGPVDYEDKWWTEPHSVWGGIGEESRDKPYDLWDAVLPQPITGYNLVAARVPGGWLATKDRRALLPLQMNWRGETLSVLLGGITSSKKSERKGHAKPADRFHKLPTISSSPSAPREAAQAISPLAQVLAGNYTTPTFFCQGLEDDFMPWKKPVEMCEALKAKGVESEIRLVEGAGHMYEMLDRPKGVAGVWRSVAEGYKFVMGRVGVEMDEGVFGKVWGV